MFWNCWNILADVGRAQRALLKFDKYIKLFENISSEYKETVAEERDGKGMEKKQCSLRTMRTDMSWLSWIRV